MAVKEMWIESGGTKLFCRMRGVGPALMLIHGVACDADYFEKAAEYLSRQFTVITYDRRGYSRSKVASALRSPQPSPNDRRGYILNVTEDAGNLSASDWGDFNCFSVASQAEDAANIWRYCRKILHKKKDLFHGHVMAEPGAAEYLCSEAEPGMAENLCQGVAVEEPDGNYGSEKVFVVGSSAGCLVAAEFARLYPEMVDGLFLHEPVFGGDVQMKEEIRQLHENLRVAAEKKRVIRGMRLFLDAMGGMDSRAAETPMEKLAQNVKNLETFLYCEMDDFLQYDIAKIEGLYVPAQIAVGECDTGGLFHRAAASAAATLGWKLVHVPGYHNLPCDLPYEFSVYISGWLHFAVSNL